MLPLSFGKAWGSEPRILCLGAHPDDIEIGCGATVLRLCEEYPKAQWSWVVLSGSEERHAEARSGVERFLGEEADVEVHLASFRDGYFPYEASEVKDFFESLTAGIQPDLVLTHYREDRHQDHRLVSDLTWNTWRDSLVFEYEIPKYDGDLGQPQCFFPVDQAIAQRKVDLILETFASQQAKEWFDAEVLRALMRIRGVECNAPSRYAEAFYARKWTWSAGGAV